MTIWLTNFFKDPLFKDVAKTICQRQLISDIITMLKVENKAKTQ